MNDPLEEAITNSNNNVHIPMNKEIEDTINYGEIKNTTCNTRFCVKQKDKSPYASISIKNCFAAIHRLHKHLDGKIKKIQDLSIIKQKKSDSLKYDEIYQILTHPELNKGTPLSITYKTYFWLCFLCGFCGGDAQRLKLANVELAAINGLTITIPCGKNNAGYTGENYIGESNITEELQRTRDMLEMSESEHQEQSIIILDLNNKIMQLQQQLKNYEHEVSELKKNLDTSYNHIDEIQNLYEEQFSKNKYLLEQWDSRFSNQQKRIEAIKEIANAECESIYDDIDLLIANSNRFSLENLMNYTPQTWLNQHNQVVVKFIETLTQN
ncbi:4848_t:CDS:2, partial [Entrophospora sp. SA101]